MRRCLTALLVVGLVTVNTRDAAAQSAKDVVAYGALMSTPVGALSPIMVSVGTKGEKPFNSLSGRYAHFSPQGGGNGSNSFGGSFFHKAGMNAAVSGTVAYGTCSGCDGTLMLGGDVHSTLWDNAAAKTPTALSINLQGSLGYGHTTNVSALSLAVGVPFAISMEQSSKARFGLFVTPGYGWGRLSGSGNSESGALPMVGLGGSWMAPEGWGLHVSYNKVFVSNISGNNMGAGFSWRM